MKRRARSQKRRALWKRWRDGWRPGTLSPSYIVESSVFYKEIHSVVLKNGDDIAVLATKLRS